MNSFSLTARTTEVILATFALMVVGFICSCSISVPGEKLAPVTSDAIQMVPGSLKVTVVEYHRNLISQDHIRVVGTVVNLTGQSVQGAYLSCTLHDQNGSPTAFGESHVSPTYLAANATGTFEFVGMLKNKKKLSATWLVCQSRLSSAYNK
ncbi:MAG: hypothetical protein LBV23_09550 [Deltaproteobacteria bacterium]|jgi:hypothetical protein|nr:hypothetical protein [Deltaproteobacteria bacterium]